MRRLGAPRLAMKCMFATLQQATHKIRTAFGVSTTMQGGTNVPPYQVLGQGNGCGPAGWTAVSAPLIRMMQTAGYGLKILTALSIVSISFVCYAFVDDTDLVHTQDTHTTGEVILGEMQSVVDHWEGGPRTTGGALVPSKSYWNLINFIWTGKDWKYASTADVPGELTIRSVDGTGRENLKRYEVDHAEETLGVYLAMDGNNQKQCEILRGKAEEYASCV